MRKTVPLSRQSATAIMNPWMEVEAFDQPCLFGFAEQHPSTGGLSWVLSTEIKEMTPAADRARTASGRIYALGREISLRELDEEGRVALRLLLTAGQDGYPGRNDDRDWVVACKVARHLRLEPPLRRDPTAVKRFLRLNADAYIAKRRAEWSGA